MPTIKARTAELLEVLDADIRHLDSMLARLNTLRTLLIRRDDPALEQLLYDIRLHAEAHEANEQKRQRLRRELAADLGCREGDLTLSRLQKELAGFATRDGLDVQAALADRQARLRSLTEQLKREHALTMLLLRDAQRLNRSLLCAFLGSAGRGGMTYGPAGIEKHQTAAALISMKL